MSLDPSEDPTSSQGDSMEYIEDLSPTQDNTNDDNVIELVVLDPNHVLMQRFQKALNESLTKELLRLEAGNRELYKDLKEHRDLHIEAANELFTVQQELSKLQSYLDSLKGTYEAAKSARIEAERSLEHIKGEYNNAKLELDDENMKMNELRKDLDNICLRLFYLRTAKNDIEGEIAVMKTSAEKSAEDLGKAGKEKMHQDFLLDALVNEVGRLKENISLYEAEVIAQTDERCAAKQTLHEAQEEIQSIILERKLLIQKWNSSVIDLTRRNESLISLSESLYKEKEEIIMLENSIGGIKRSFRKYRDINEQSTLILKKNELILKSIERNVVNSQVKLETLQKLYDTTALVLQTTENEYSRVLKEKKEEDLLIISNYIDIERYSKLKYDLKEKITEEIKKKLILKHIVVYTDKKVKDSRDKSRHIESQLVIMMNSFSKDTLQIVVLKSSVVEIQKYLDKMSLEIDEKHKIINKLEVEISRSKVNVEIKQAFIDNLNKQWADLLKCRGGMELGPLEITITHLNRDINASFEEITNLEQKWLFEQEVIVKLFVEKDNLRETIRRTKQMLTLLRQKKMKNEGLIQQENSQIFHLEKELINIRNDLVQTNRVIYEESYNEEKLEQINWFVETDFVRALKEEELSCIQMQSRIDDIIQEKDDLLKKIVETEWQVMMYEKKIQLVREENQTMKSNIGQGEIITMRKEIQSMETRYKHLKQQQEKLIQEMEKSVFKRDIMTTRGEALERISHKVLSNGTVERQTSQIKRKIKETVEGIEECEKKAAEQKILLQRILERMKLQRDTIVDTGKTLRDLESQVNEIVGANYLLFVDLQYLLQQTKYFIDLKNGSYTKMCKTKASLEKEKKSIAIRGRNLFMIIEDLCRTFPEVSTHLYPLRTGILGAMRKYYS